MLEYSFKLVLIETDPVLTPRVDYSIWLPEEFHKVDAIYPIFQMKKVSHKEDEKHA